jgi:NitT/TauT family transport system substrate-binding protein
MSTYLTKTTFRLFGPRVLVALCCAFGAATAMAQDKFTFLTSWFAQAEHGGFFQASAAGIYAKYGLDVTIKQGGPQVNTTQLLMGGAADAIMGYDFTVLSSVQEGIPLTTVAASMQADLQGMMTHDDVPNLGALKGKTILVSTPGRNSWWPWLKAKYGYTEDQTRAYTFNLQPFFADPNTAQQAFISSEPFQATKAGTKVNFFLFANDGYPPYGTTIVTTRQFIDTKPDVMARFVKATMEGWKSYLADPTLGNAMIKQYNPTMSDEQIAFGVAKLKEIKVVTGGDAAKFGIGTITEERWKKTYEYMVASGLLKADTDWHKAFTTQFIKDAKVMP